MTQSEWPTPLLSKLPPLLHSVWHCSFGITVCIRVLHLTFENFLLDILQVTIHLQLWNTLLLRCIPNLCARAFNATVTGVLCSAQSNYRIQVRYDLWFRSLFQNNWSAGMMQLHVAWQKFVKTCLSSTYVRQFGMICASLGYSPHGAAIGSGFTLQPERARVPSLWCHWNFSLTQMSTR